MLSNRVISRARLYEVIRWSGLLCCALMMRRKTVVYSSEFGVVFLAKGSHAASLQEGLDCLGLHHSGLERKEPPNAHPACAGPPGNFNGHVQGFCHGARYVGVGLHMFRDLPGRFDSHHCPRCTRWRHAHVCLLRRHVWSEGSANLYDDFYHLFEPLRRSRSYAGVIACSIPHTARRT